MINSSFGFLFVPDYASSLILKFYRRRQLPDRNASSDRRFI